MGRISIILAAACLALLANGETSQTRAEMLEPCVPREEAYRRAAFLAQVKGLHVALVRDAEAAAFHRAMQSAVPDKAAVADEYLIIVTPERLVILGYIDAGEGMCRVEVLTSEEAEAVVAALAREIGAVSVSLVPPAATLPDATATHRALAGIATSRRVS